MAIETDKVLGLGEQIGGIIPLLTDHTMHEP